MKHFELRKAPGTPLRLKLFWYISLFFLFVVLILWLFQVVFMDNFYLMVTENQIEKSSRDISAAIKNGDDPGNLLYDVAEKTGVCVSVYRIKDDSGTKLSEAHIKNGCYIHNFISGENLNLLYKEAKRVDGMIVSEIVSPEKTGDRNLAIYSRVVTVDGSDYLMLFNTEKFPVAVMAMTVTVQLSIIIGILLIGAAVLAVVLSRKITRPVSTLSREAEKLAHGDYTVDNVHSGILEINRLGDTITYAASELERSDRMKKELIANVTHDLRTPLTMISGYGEMMRDIPGEMSAENIQVIVDESARLSGLVNDVLEMSRAQSGTMMLRPVRFSLTGSVRSTVARYAEMLRAKDYTVDYESDGAECTVIADEAKLMQAFCNLLNNAVNFTGESKRVVIRQYMKDGMYRTEVTDFGLGIPEEELESIWERYYRVRDFKMKGIPGSGLGLAIVKHILLLHDVSFGVESTVGEGSTFWFEMKPEK